MLVQIVAVAFMILTFQMVLPVSRQRRLLRIADAVGTDLQRTLDHGRTLDEASTHLLEYDRMAQAATWSGRQMPARAAVLDRIGQMIDLDLALRRAWSGLARPELDAAMVHDARSALLSRDPARFEDSAAALLADPAGCGAVSGLHAAGRLLRQQRHALHRYGIVA